VSDPAVPEPSVQTTGYQLFWFPEDDPDAFVWSLTVEWRGGETWAVCHHRYCLSATGEWDFEVRPSEREEGWVAAHRFNLDTALSLAKEAGPKLNINGFTIADLLAKKALLEASP
jgi:hypothetical protein